MFNAEFRGPLGQSSPLTVQATECKLHSENLRRDPFFFCVCVVPSFKQSFEKSVFVHSFTR